MAAHLSPRLSRRTRMMIAITVVAVAVGLVGASPAARAAEGHYVSHGRLWCDPDRDKVGVGNGMTASVRPGESVRLQHSLYRWTPSGWALDSSRAVRSYPTSNAYVSTLYAQWYAHWFYFDGTFDAAWGMPLWYGWHGHRYSIIEDIKWFSLSGAVVDEHRQQLVGPSGNTYCSL